MPTPPESAAVVVRSRVDDDVRIEGTLLSDAQAGTGGGHDRAHR
jgi:hypothetical protein